MKKNQSQDKNKEINDQSIIALNKEIQLHLFKYSDRMDELSDETGISKSTLWRWSRHINNKFPDPDLLLSFARYDSGKKTLKEIINYYSKPIGSFLKSSFYSIYLYEEEIYGANKEYIICDEYEFTIYHICGTERGATESELVLTIGDIIAMNSNIPDENKSREILKSLGQLAIDKIDKLIKFNILYKDSNGFCKRQSKPGGPNVKIDDQIYRTIELFKKSIRPKFCGQKSERFIAFQESIPLSSMKEISNHLKSSFGKSIAQMESTKASSQEMIPAMVGVFITSLLYPDSEA